jgi:cytoskeletal protein CcmA (bactofilin family)
MFNSKKPESAFDSGETTFGVANPSVTRSYGTISTGTEENCSIINEPLTMKGDLESEGDILVRGKVLGNIRCKMLIVDTSASIEGGIVANEVIVRGKTKGVINASRVRLEKSADVDSEIFQDSFAAEEGARINGALRFKADAPADLKVVAAE